MWYSHSHGSLIRPFPMRRQKQQFINSSARASNVNEILSFPPTPHLGNPRLCDLFPNACFLDKDWLGSRLVLPSPLPSKAAWTMLPSKTSSWVQGPNTSSQQHTSGRCHIYVTSVSTHGRLGTHTGSLWHLPSWSIIVGETKQESLPSATGGRSAETGRCLSQHSLEPVV